MLEVEELKKVADAKAAALQGEVSALRDEIKSLRILMGGSESSADRKQKK